MFEFFFKYPLAAFSRGQLLFAARWPWWIMLAVLAAAAAALAYSAFRNRVVAAPRVKPVVIWLLQSAMVAILLVLLWQPALSVATLRPQQNVVSVVVDDSGSMGLREGGETRMDQVHKYLNANVLSDLQKKFQVRLYRIG